MTLKLLSTGLVTGLDPKAGLADALKKLHPVNCCCNSTKDNNNDNNKPEGCCELQAKSTAQSRPVEYLAKFFISPGLDRSAAGVAEIVSALKWCVPPRSRFIAALGLDFTDCGELTESDLELLAALFSASQAGITPVQAGVADFSAPRLEQLLTRLGKDIPIQIDLINATECCALPPDILALSQREGIQLLAHHDPAAFFDSEPVKAASEALGVSLSDWAFLLRIVASDAERQVLAGTEYIIGYY